MVKLDRYIGTSVFFAILAVLGIIVGLGILGLGFGHFKTQRSRDLTQDVVRQFFLALTRQQLFGRALRSQQ